MKTLAVTTAVAALALAAPAVNGPDQDRQPAVKYLFTAKGEPTRTAPGVNRFTVRCPRGMLAVSASPEFPASYIEVRGRRAVVVGQSRDPSGLGPDSGVTVVCLEGRVR